MKNKNHLRDFLDAQIGDYLTARNIFYSRLISGEIGGKIRRENCRKTLSRDGENYGKIRGRRGVLKKFSEAKTPVRFCIIRGRIIFIELETRSEKPDTKRLAWREMWRNAGAFVVVAASFESFADQFSAIRAALESAKRSEFYD